MKIKFKKNIAVSVCIIALIDIIIGFLLFKSRLFSHLAIWDIIESDKQEDFYWPLENAPKYFYFEPDSNKLSDFRKEIFPLVKNETDGFQLMLTAAKYVINISSNNAYSNSPLKWNSPEEMLKQVKQGAAANCFHRAILFSTYLSSIGIKSRLWTLENDNFNNIAHSINEVYVKDFKKWVFIDVMFGFYVAEDRIPLSLLEFRERLLNGNANEILLVSLRANKVNEAISMKIASPPESTLSITEGAPRNDTIVPPPLTGQLPTYRRLIKCVFLRADNDFVNIYNRRYGILGFAQQYIDKFPADIRRGLDYLLTKQKFIHYIDKFSKSLRLETILAKLFFYFLAFSSAAVGIFFAGRLFRILSHKDTRQK